MPTDPGTSPVQGAGRAAIFMARIVRPVGLTVNRPSPGPYRRARFHPREASPMSRSRAAIVLLILAAWAVPASAQVRARPQSAKGGEAQGEPWAEVSEMFRHMTLPDWPVPTDLERWQQVDRPATREVLVKLLGAMPPRPDPARVEVVAREEHDGYTLERLRFHNGVDEVVPGLLLLPKGRKGPVPAVVGLHGHGSNKETVVT